MKEGERSAREPKTKRQKNAELMERISMLEAEIRESSMDTQENHQHAVAISSKKFKKQKIEMVADEVDTMTAVKSEMASHYKPDIEGIVPKEISPAKCLINWTSMDDNQNLYHEKFKDTDSIADFNETDSEDACDDITETVNAQNGYPHVDEESEVTCMGSFYDHRSDPTGNVRQEEHQNQKTSCILLAQLSKKSEIKTYEGKQIKGTAGYTTSQNRKPPKVAFCPKEVKRMIESEALLQKNAQSHTMRKIIVFASLGIRHGCEDMYELGFNHFRILKKGEPFVSPSNPGEHVFYENPGIGRKIFYPYRQNLVLCPVQIVEEERAMRPSDASCPSSLFLCIKLNMVEGQEIFLRMTDGKK